MIAFGMLFLKSPFHFDFAVVSKRLDSIGSIAYIENNSFLHEFLIDARLLLCPIERKLK